MATIRFKDNWVQFNSNENQSFEEEDEEEETLSLCDLPINKNELETNSEENDKYDQEDFEFGSCHAAAANKSPQNLCNADDIFFQGQILPLRHSVSSETKPTHTRIINRSASLTDPRSKRPNGYRIRNQFHSHPSPSPQIRSQSFRTLSHSTHKTSSLWSFLQVGLVKPQEIGLSDLKNRSKRFGSHNSNSSSNSTSSGLNSSTDQNQTKATQNPRINTKKKQRLFFGSGCKCSVSVDSITNERTIKETVVQNHKTTKEEDIKSTMIGGERKQTVSRHRTFEWLKQLSIAAPSEA